MQRQKFLLDIISIRKGVDLGPILQLLLDDDQP
jgi:hypothetical protein